ncbi:hypothetical protein DD557_05030 [Thalassobacter stenotrophicus]|nr:hypothetical protein DD557_05030 [Thalassobacter stenotrophicus]
MRNNVPILFGFGMSVWKKRRIRNGDAP